MDYYGIKEVEGNAVETEYIVKRKQRRKNILSLTMWGLGALNVVAYALLAVKVF